MISIAVCFDIGNDRHAQKEETQVLPLAEEHLTDEDWAAIEAAFTDHSDPLFGDKAEKEFSNLFSALSVKIAEFASKGRFGL